MIDEQGNNFGVVYFLLAPSCNRVKIGYATDPHSRIGNIKTMCPCDLVPLGIIAALRHEEQEWHQRFAESRLHGEWFTMTPELKEAIDVAIEREGLSWPTRKQSIAFAHVTDKIGPLPGEIYSLNGHTSNGKNGKGRQKVST